MTASYIGMFSYIELRRLIDGIHERPYTAFRTPLAVRIKNALAPQRNLTNLFLGNYADENDPARILDLEFLEYVAKRCFIGVVYVSFGGFVEENVITDGHVATPTSKNVSVLWDFS